MQERRFVELTRLVDRLEAAAHDIIPAAIQYTMDWADPEDIERWYTAEQLGNPPGRPAAAALGDRAANGSIRRAGRGRPGIRRPFRLIGRGTAAL